MPTQKPEPLVCSCGAVLRDEYIVWAHGAAGHFAIEGALDARPQA